MLLDCMLDSLFVLRQKFVLRFENKCYSRSRGRFLAGGKLDFGSRSCFPANSFVCILVSTFDNQTVSKHERTEQPHSELSDQISLIASL